MHLRSLPSHPPHRAAGSVIVSLLWCLALLALLVVGILHSATMDLRLAGHFRDRLQARYLALAGIERAKALLYQDARDRTRSALSHRGSLANDPSQFRDIEFGRGTYRVFRGARADEGGGLVFGVADEESRLNLNQADAATLARLPSMPAEVPPAIMDWRDGDNAVTPGGAEADYYASLRPPSRPRNGPFLSTRELLMVRGLPRDLLLGDDTHDTGLREATGDDADDDPSAAAAVVPGWISLLTVHSGVHNTSAAGVDRVNLQSADEATLTGIRGLTPEIAKAIIAHRGQNRLESIANLLDVGPPPRTDQPGAPAPSGPRPLPGPNVLPGAGPGPGPGAGGGPAPGLPGRGGGPNPDGPKLIDVNLLIDIADQVTTDDASLQEGLVNVNTASLEVLACLPGVDRQLAQAIIAYRSSSGFLDNIAHLLRVPGMTTDVFKGLAAHVTTRSETYRLLAEGRIRSSGVRQRLQAIVRVDARDAQTLAYREDDL